MRVLKYNENSRAYYLKSEWLNSDEVVQYIKCSDEDFIIVGVHSKKDITGERLLSILKTRNGVSRNISNETVRKILKAGGFTEYIKGLI